MFPCARCGRSVSAVIEVGGHDVCLDCAEVVASCVRPGRGWCPPVLTCPVTGATIPKEEARTTRQCVVDRRCPGDASESPCYPSCGRDQQRWVYSGRDIEDC